MRIAAMVGVAAVSAVFTCGCLMSPPIAFGGGKSRTQAQRQGLGKLFPVPLTAPRKWRGEVRVAKLRVWADAEYRAQNVRWQHDFEDQLDSANQVLTTRERIRQIEAKALRKLRHPTRSERLKSFLESSE